MMLGAFLLLLATAAPAQADCRPSSDRAHTHLHVADVAIGRGQFRDANRALDQALAALGTSYGTPAINDDTDMHLVIADDQQRKGKLKLAAQLKRRILVERLQLCGSKRR